MGVEYKFYFSREGSVYFNIRGEGSVIQSSLRGGECNLLKILNRQLFRDTRSIYEQRQNVRVCIIKI
jgi:hypothetical protein